MKDYSARSYSTMAYKDAIEMAIEIINGNDTINSEQTTKCLEKLATLYTKYSTPRTVSEEAKAQANAKRKEQNAKERNALMEKVLPVLREGLTHTQIGLTAKELYDTTKASLPEDFSDKKVQYILLHELASKVEKIEAKGKANLYRLAQ